MSSNQETLSWQPGSYTLEYLLKNLPLPQVVRCDHSACGEERGSSEALGCGPPLLLHSVSDLPRAVGVCLIEDFRHGKSLKETEIHLVVPFDYKGWFIMSGSKPKNDDVPVYHDLTSLVYAGCNAFLIGGNEKMQILRKIPTAYAFAPALAYPGNSFKPVAVIQHEKKYLQCVNETNQIILIDYEQKGTFYMTSTRNKNLKVPHVLQMRDIISRFQHKLPCAVKLLMGKEPIHDCFFGGWIKLTSVERVVTLIASTVTIGENKLVEIPKKGSLKFNIATLNSAWREYSGYHTAARLCRKSAEEYRKSIKRSDVIGTSSRMLRRSSDDVSREALLDMSVSKGFAPMITKVRHYHPRAVNTIFQSEKYPKAKSDHEAGERCEKPMSGDQKDRNYKRVPKVPQSKDFGYASLIRNNGSGETRNSYLTVVQENDSGLQQGSSKNNYLTVIPIPEEHKPESTKTGGCRPLETTEADQSSTSETQSWQTTSIYANQDCLDETDTGSMDGTVIGRMNVTELIKMFDPKFTVIDVLDDSNDYVNVDEIGLDELKAPRPPRSPDYVNLAEYPEIRDNRGRRVWK